MDEAARHVEPAPSPWPAAAVFGTQGLQIAGISATDLASRYGTPLIVIDEDDLRARCRSMLERFPRVLYAAKAFTCHAMFRVAMEEGLDLLVATDGELEAATRAGVPGARIAFHGNNKSDRELELAVTSRVSIVVVDHPDELPRLDAAARGAAIVQPVLIRVIPGVDTQTHPAIATGHAESSFGTPMSDAPAAIRLAGTLSGLRFAGVHAHLGSQLLGAEPYLLEVDALLDLLAAVREEPGDRTLDIGGGFGVSYTDERALDIDDLAGRVLARVREGAAERGIDPPMVAVEPGRSLVANAGVTLYRVGATKEVRARRFVAVDGGMSDNPRRSLYGARYEVAEAGVPAPGPPSAVTVVGRHCESGDVVADDVILSGGVGRGDLLAVAATGAYTYSMAGNYNRAGRPAVVAVRGGRHMLWLRREDAGDLDRLEAPSRRRSPGATVPEGVVVRPASPRDAKAFLEFWTEIVAEGRYVRSETVRHAPRVYRARFRHSWTDREAQVLAMDGDRVVGNIYAAREEHPVTNHVATLGIAVAASHRGRGLGTVLLTEVFRWAESVGVEKILLSVYPHNTAAIALYRKFGFVEEGRLARQSRKAYGYDDEILMASWIGAEGSGR